MNKQSRTKAEQVVADAPQPSSSTDLFDLDGLRLRQDFNLASEVKKALITVPCRKPGRQEFVMVHPDKDYQIETMTIELTEDREIYLVDPKLWSALPGELKPKALFTTMNREGVLSIWPVNLPVGDGKVLEWTSSQLQAAAMAKKGWIRMQANMSLGAYEVFQALGDLPPPNWPTISFQEILKIAFKNHFIDSLDHDVLKRLRGEL